MRIKVRMALLLGALLVAFLATLQLLRRAEIRRAKVLSTESLQANRQLLDRWIDLTSRPLRRLGQDYSQWPAMADFITNHDQAWAETNLRANLANYEAHAAWVLDAKGNVVYSTQQRAGPPLPPPASPTGQNGPDHFFAESRDGLLEIWREPIGLDPRGWLLVARAWDGQFLSTLGRLAEATIQLIPPGPPAPAQEPSRLILPLQNPEGTTLRQLQANFPAPDFSTILASDSLNARLFVVFGLLVIVAMWLGVRQWVLRPLGQIGESLAGGEIEPILPLLAEKNELGRVAQLVESSFAHQSALQGEIEERKRVETSLRESEQQVRRSFELRDRLARDLHDGVIQSIYAAGLGLESALSQVEHDPAGARIRMQHCRQSLNGVIREVRGFINGLEPEQMHRQGFAQELTALARTMEALGPVHIVLEIHPQVADRLSPAQEVHALQIARECISNALRHGGATEVRITLEQGLAGGRLLIKDNGRGFDPEAPPGHGNGLINLATRAREMGGSLKLDAQPGQGAAVVIIFNLSPSAP